eukprot:7507223-Ditylum_brightwellii.AAC.1
MCALMTKAHLPTTKPIQTRPPSTPINNIWYIAPSVVPIANTSVFSSLPQQPDITPVQAVPTEQTHVNTRVPNTPNKKTTLTPVQDVHTKQTHGNTRVPNTSIRKQPYRHTKNTRNTSHRIPPTGAMPLPKTPPMYIPTPKG